MSIDEKYFVKLSECPICGSTDIPTHIKETRRGDDLRYSMCQNCRQLFLNPRMSDDYTKEYYTHIYRDTIADDLLHNQKRVKYQIKLMSDKINSGSMVLEIGSGSGFLLDSLARMGYGVIGIEPDIRHQQSKNEPASKYTVIQDISELVPTDFDLICMSHSLEHLNHPVEYIENLVQNYSHPGSRFLIEVPNLSENSWAMIVHHAFAYSSFTLDKLFERCGCKKISCIEYGMDDIRPLYLLAVYEVLPRIHNMPAVEVNLGDQLRKSKPKRKKAKSDSQTG
jgi:SAM-dependent methyltransferase